MDKLFTGAGVALVTPFRENKEIDFNGLEKIIGNQLKGGTDYLVALGTTAETPTLTSKEKKEIVEFIKQKSDLPLVAGMGGNNTNKIIKQINNFNFEGVDALLIVTPYYNKPSQEGMFRHYLSIAKESPVPIILYNVPSRTGVNLKAETVIRLANESDNIVAVKEASGNIAQMAKICKYAPDHFSVISGDDAMSLPLISIGGKGVISVVSNALPAKVSNLIHKALKGNFDDARDQHLELLELFKLLFKEGNPAGVKALLSIQGIIKNELRPPLSAISSDTYNKIKKAYEKLA
jgi:4-hydroxy-tetrahydrodipicolinate synthase